MEGYSDSGLADVQASCRVSCGYCGKASSSALTVQEKPAVSVRMGFKLDLAEMSEAERVEALKTSLAAALGVDPQNMVDFTVAEVADEGQRRLADGVKYDVRAEVVVPESATARDIIMQATSLTVEGSSALDSFSTALVEEGVDASALEVEVTERPAATSVIALVGSDGAIAAVAGAAKVASISSTSEGSSAVLVTEDCTDDPLFIDEQGDGCSGWIGYDCSSAKWLSGERPYTAAGLLALQKACLISCGICEPPARQEPAALLAECADDAFMQSFCLLWRGLECSLAPEFGYGAKYAATLMERCPLSCGLCGVGELPCDDSLTFVDELGYSCASWAGYGCTKMYASYTRKGVLRVQALCPESCGFCTASVVGSERRLAADASSAAACEDNSSFSYLSMFSCGTFKGRFCSYPTLLLEPRWLLGPRAAWAFHDELWTACPVSCGLCKPEGTPSAQALLIECLDEATMADWCSYYWAGQDCSSWPQSVRLVLAGEPERFNKTLFEGCPATCDLCEPPVCEQGTFRNRTSHSCDDCAPGRFASEQRPGVDALSCDLARPGFHVPAAGSSSEEPCPRGAYSAQQAAASCTLCSPGRFADNLGFSGCLACSPGKYQDEAGAVGCTLCPPGRFTESFGSVFCQNCSSTFSTKHFGSVQSEDCECPRGRFIPHASRFEANASCAACIPGLACPGGQRAVNRSSLDRTAKLLPGMMALPEDPLSVYSCVGGEETCAGERPLPIEEELLAEVCAQDRSGARCHVCPDGWYRTGDSCAECEDIGIWPNSWKCLVAVGFSFWGTLKSYEQQGRNTTAAKIMFLTLLSFCQVLKSVSVMDLRWPPIMDWFFGLLLPFSIDGFFTISDFRQECMFGDSFFFRMLRDVTVPLVPLFNFSLLGFVFLSIGKPLHKPFVWNVLACIYSGFFVSITIMSMQLFFFDKMPNGSYFLQGNYAIKDNSVEWRTAVPVALAAVLIYCCGFFTYTLLAIRKAPRLVASDDSFMEQYDYLVADVRPECFWWSMIDLTYGFSVATVQALTANAYWQVYVSTILVLVFLMVEVHIKPSIHSQVNNVNLALKFALLMFLIFCSAFIDADSIDPEETKLAKLSFGRFLIAVFIANMLTCGIYLVHALYTRFVLPPNDLVFKTACTTRSLLEKFTYLPTQEMLASLHDVNEVEVRMMESLLSVTLAVFFKQQSADRWSQLRIIPDAPFKVHDPHEMKKCASRPVVQHEGSGKILHSNAHLRSNISKLAALSCSRAPAEESLSPADSVMMAYAMQHSELSEHRSGLLERLATRTDAAHCNSLADFVRDSPLPAGWRQALEDSRLAQSAHRRYVQLLRRHGLVHMSQDEFVEDLSGSAGLSDEDLAEIFDAVDVQGEGQLRPCEILRILRYACLYEDNSGEHRLRQLLQETEDGLFHDLPIDAGISEASEDPFERYQDLPMDENCTVHMTTALLPEMSASASASACAAAAQGLPPDVVRSKLDQLKREREAALGVDEDSGQGRLNQLAQEPEACVLHDVPAAAISEAALGVVEDSGQGRLSQPAQEPEAAVRHDVPAAAISEASEDPFEQYADLPVDENCSVRLTTTRLPEMNVWAAASHPPASSSGAVAGAAARPLPSPPRAREVGASAPGRSRAWLDAADGGCGETGGEGQLGRAAGLPAAGLSAPAAAAPPSRVREVGAASAPGRSRAWLDEGESGRDQTGGEGQYAARYEPPGRSAPLPVTSRPRRDGGDGGGEPGGKGQYAARYEPPRRSAPLHGGSRPWLDGSGTGGKGRYAARYEPLGRPAPPPAP